MHFLELRTNSIVRKMSQYFQQHLGSLYKPTAHWTSSLRSRAGYAHFADSLETGSFTFSGKDVSSKIAQILACHGIPEGTSQSEVVPTVHFDIAITPNEGNGSFYLHLSQFERVSTLSIGPDPWQQLAKYEEF